MAIAWDPSLSTGIVAVDAQHQELFQRIDRLLEASVARRSTHEVGAMLDFLAEYVREHFGTEERIMERTRYPEAAAHRAEHEAFTRDLEALREEYAREGGTALVVVRVTSRATQWLSEHIYRADKRLGKYVADRRRPGGEDTRI